MSVNFLSSAWSGLRNQFRHKSAPLTFSTVLLGASSVFSSVKDITVLNSSNSEFHFVVDFSGNGNGLRSNQSGDSILYLNRAIQIGIPDGATPRLILSQGSNVVPYERVFSKVDGQEHRLISAPLATLSDIWTMRGRKFVTVLVSPVTGESIYSKVEIKISFEGTEPAMGSSIDDPGFNRVFSTAIANWDEAKNWPSSISGFAKVSFQPGPFSLMADWFKLAVNQSGVYAVTFDQLRTAGLIGNSAPSSTIFMYSGGGRQVNPRLTDPRPVFQQTAITVEDGGDGIFQSGDRIMFYGESLNRWTYDSTGAGYINNVYATENVYWLAVSTDISETPLRMTTSNSAPTGTAIDTFNTYTHYVHVEQENMLRQFNDGQYDDYYFWYWTQDESLTVFVPVANPQIGQTADIFLSAKTFDTTGNADAIGYIDLSVNNQPALSKSCNLSSCSYQTTSLTAGLNRFAMRLWGSVISRPYFDYLEVSYDRTTVPLSNILDASFGPYSGLNRVDITDNFTSTPLIFNVSNPNQPVRLTGAVRLNGQVSLETNFALNSPNRILAVSSSSVLSPASITMTTPVDLYSSPSSTDLIIITARALVPALNEYVTYRSSQGVSIQTVAVEDIMDNFGFGLYDPSAIRDFLKHSYENYPSPVPSAVLFVGDANYDFLDRQTTGVPNVVPAYLFQFDETLSDDNYVYFGQFGLIDADSSYITGDRGFDMISARWPVNTVAEINSIVAKIKSYESVASFDSWRTKITLVADDENSPVNSPLIERVHTTQTEELSTGHIPNQLNQKKVYSWEYPFVNRDKPEVNTAIVKEANDGALVINYVGHGSPDVWAHEHIFSRTADLPRLANGAKLPLVFAASCAISFFDDPKREGMAEDLLVMNGGAVGIVAATRLVYSAENADFNKEVFDIMLYNDSLTLCEAVYTAKLLRQYITPTTPIPNTNDRNYLYFGDPYLRLGLPSLNVVADSTLDSLQALQPTRITGRIQLDDSSLYNSDGRLVINVYDSKRNKSYTIPGTSFTVPYSVAGPTLFRGTAGITNGTFDFTFIPPLDIGYGGNGARVSLYAVLDTIDAAGVLDSIAVSTAVATTTDSIGPNIGVMFSGAPLQPGGNVIKIGDLLNITLTDSSGINLAEGIGHGITLETDNDVSSLKNLTELFQYNQDDFTGGTLNYNLDSLLPGLHSFKIKAWDNANNSSTLSFAAEITTSSSLAIQDLLNYPNPMVDRTSFSFSLTQSVDRFSLEIFTLSGREINSFDRYALAPAYYDDIVWDGRDAYGDRVSTGVYLYKATAVPAAGDKVEEFGKIILINQ